jgi:hypothetical protein
MYPLRLTLFALLTGVSCLAQAPAPAAAAAAVESFYKAYQTARISGLPDDAKRNVLTPHLTPELNNALRRARTEQERCRKRHPDEKPPWVEGDLFSSNFEGFTSVRVLPGADDKRQTLTLQFEYVENGQKVQWKDQVIVENRTGRWLIDDVRYGGVGSFGNGFGKSLRQSLSGKGCS